MIDKTDHRVIVLAGSNINPQENLKKFKEIFERLFKKTRFSKIIKTKPVGFINQQDFLNQTIYFETGLNLYEIEAKLKKIENDLGRIRDPINKNAPRTIDLDVIQFDSSMIGRDVYEKPFVKDLIRDL